MNFKKTTLTIIISIWSSFSLFAQRGIVPKEVARLFEKTGELYFSFSNEPGLEIRKITHLIAIDYVDQKTIKAFANQKQFEAFLELGIPYEILKRPSETADIQMSGANELYNRLKITSTYPTYSQYEQLMAEFASNHSSICKLVNLGTLASGRKIWALKISDNVNSREYEPQFLYTSTMHGDETAGYPMMLNLIEYLLTNYGSNARINRLVNNMEIWINPLANPDGTYRGGNNTVAQATRFNANNVDLNRNYPDPRMGAHPDGNPHQQETKIFMAWADTMDLVMAANLHGGIELINYPWDTWNNVIADKNWWLKQSFKYADSAQTNSPAGYFMANIPGGDRPGVTNGFNWYEVAGGRQDYMNWWKHCREVTIELSNTKLIPNNEILNHWIYNRGALLSFMEASLQGIKGIVTDSCTGRPIKARITVNNHDLDSSFVYTSLPIGNFHRPIEAGTWSITISANGYIPKTFNGLTVSNEGVIELITSLSPSFPKATAILGSSFSCEGRFQFTDISGNSSNWNWNFGDGSTSDSQNPSHVYAQAGTYSVTLTTSNCKGSSALPATIPIHAVINREPITQNDTALTCGSVSLRLGANAPGTISWFPNAVGGQSLFSGNNFTTPALRESKTYYVQSTISGQSQTVGPASNLIGNGGYFTGNTYHYVIFDAHANTKIVAVTLYTNQDGNKNIELRNADGQLVRSAIVNARAGENRIVLNFSVPKGNGYRLGTAASSRLYRNISGASYPYSIAGLVSINGNSAGDPGYYYYFYNWEIQSLCESDRVPVFAVSKNNLRLETSISATEPTVCQYDSIRLQASSNLPGTSFKWLINNVLNPQFNSGIIKLQALIPGQIRFSVIGTSPEACVINPNDTTTNLNISVLQAPPSPVITWQPPLLISNISQGMVWTKNGLVLQGSLNQDTIIPDGQGIFSGYVIDQNICKSLLSNSVEILITDLHPSFGLSSEFAVYPNPNSGRAVLFCNYERRLNVINNLGQKIKTIHCLPGKNVINLVGFSPGMYFVCDSQNGRWIKLNLQP